MDGDGPSTGTVTVAGFGAGQDVGSTVQAGLGNVPAAQLWVVYTNRLGTWLTRRTMLPTGFALLLYR